MPRSPVVSEAMGTSASVTGLGSGVWGGGLIPFLSADRPVLVLDISRTPCGPQTNSFCNTHCSESVSCLARLAWRCRPGGDSCGRNTGVLVYVPNGLIRNRRNGKVGGSSFENGRSPDTLRKTASPQTDKGTRGQDSLRAEGRLIM